MLERMIVKHWIALTVGFTLLGVLIRVRYNTQGHFAIGGEWLAPGSVKSAISRLEISSIRLILLM